MIKVVLILYYGYNVLNLINERKKRTLNLAELGFTTYQHNLIRFSIASTTNTSYLTWYYYNM